MWRVQKDETNKRCGPAVHRNPLFSGLGIDPTTGCAIDTMHALCGGPIMSIASTIIWMIILSNPWNLHGTKEARLDMGCKRMRDMLMEWQVKAKIPWGDRIGDLTLSTLGGGPVELECSDDGVFTGGTMR
eukprot:5130450-Pyramimonas_sp.AAC.1